MKLFSRRYLVEPVDQRHGDIALLICCLVTGLVEAVSFLNWGVFCAMQTGNTVILGLSTADLPPSLPYGWVTTLVSLSTFLVGSYLTSLCARHAAPLRRATVMISFGIQALLVILAAALTTTSLVPTLRNGHGDVPDDIRIVTAIPPLAFHGGMQIATSRILGFNELPTNVLTSAYADLVGDAGLFKLNNRKRDRRAASAVLLLGGAIIGGWLMRAGIGAHGVLWIAAGLKVFIFLGVWGFMESKELPVRQKDEAT